MARSCTNMLAHIIFSTKERAPLIRPDLAPRLFAYLGGIARELHSVALAIHGMPDQRPCAGPPALDTLRRGLPEGAEDELRALGA